MNSKNDDRTGQDRSDDRKPPARRPTDPRWTDGLKQLYDSVVDEELPDSFKDLLSKLDKD